MSTEAHVKALVDRILRLKEEQDTLSDDIKDIYAEAKAQGYNKTALGEVVAHLRKLEKKGQAALDERTALFDLYLAAYEQPSHAHAREARFGAARQTGELHEDQPDTKLQRTGVSNPPEPSLGAPSAGHGSNESPAANSMRELHDEAEGQGGVIEHGREEGSQSRLPSDRAEITPAAPAVIAGGTNPQSTGAPAPGSASPLPAHGAEEVAGSNSKTVRSDSSPDRDGPDAGAGTASGNLSDEPYVPLSFQIRKLSLLDLRPHCLNPDLCAGYGREYCHACKREMAKEDAA